MQSVMQMFVARFASRNPCISWMLVLLAKLKGTFEGAGLQPRRERCRSKMS